MAGQPRALDVTITGYRYDMKRTDGVPDPEDFITVRFQVGEARAKVSIAAGDMPHGYDRAKHFDFMKQAVIRCITTPAEGEEEGK